MTEEQIKHMAERFLGWKLPEDFSPDGGVTFVKVGNPGTPHEYKNEPVGTNIFDYLQAIEMVRHMVEGLPEGEYPTGLTRSDHIAHDMRVGRFPKRSSVEVFLAELEEECPGHAASDEDPKVCRHCFVHIDSLRPD